MRGPFQYSLPMLKTQEQQCKAAALRRCRPGLLVFSGLIASLASTDSALAQGDELRGIGEHAQRSRLTVGGRLHQEVRPQAAASSSVTENAAMQALPGAGPLVEAKGTLEDEQGQGGDFFGDQIAVDGSTMVIGAWGSDEAGTDSGSAFVATQVDGVWRMKQTLIPSQPQVQARFGYSVAIAGDWIAVASVDDTVDGIESRGSVELFRRNSETGTWDFVQKIVADDASQGDSFGFSITISDRWLAVGAPNLDVNDQKDQGGVYLYRINPRGARWDFVQRIDRGENSEGQTEALFGTAVSLYADRVAVGAPGDDTRAINAGAVYLYGWDVESQRWEATRKLSPEDAQARDAFGQAVDFNGFHCLVGSPGVDDSRNRIFEAGAAYVYKAGASWRDWILDTKLMADSPKQAEFFGLSVALGERTAIVGAFEERSQTPVAGRAFVFARSGARVWSQVQTLAPRRSGAGYGFGLDVDSGWIAVGAYNDQSSPNRSGRVYTYQMEPLPAPVLGGYGWLLLLGLGVGVRRRG